MKEQIDDKEQKSYTIKVGKRMKDLIDYVTNKFEKEYGFRPSSTNVTNLIADRTNENGLF